ncbi:MAG: hypothetical protein IJU33_05035 [Bacteroidales bacterium]|nr:hypothetical protein [Bacteroidales bacterium]
MKKWTWILMAVLAVITSLAITIATLEGAHRRSLAKQVKEQSVVIDSLLKRKPAMMDVKLYVTDRSKNNIYGRYNKGTITIPTVKTYKLEVDSLAIYN